MGDIWLCTGKKRTGIKPGFILTVSADNNLSVWDEKGIRVHFMDLEQSGEQIAELPLDRYIDGGHGREILLDLFGAMTGEGEGLLLRAGKSAPGIHHDFIMAIEPRQNLLVVWDDKGTPAHFKDVKRKQEYDALPLDVYTNGGRPGFPFLKLLAAMADCDLNYITHSMTKIRCRGEVANMTLYRVMERNRMSRIYTPECERHSPSARPVTR